MRKWQLITDLSSPEGATVNDGIDPHFYSVEYTSVDEAVPTAIHLGKGAILAKFDLESAYRMVPVHPHDRLLLRMCGRAIHMTTELFRLGSAQLQSSSLLWQMHCYGSCRDMVCSVPCTIWMTSFCWARHEGRNMRGRCQQACSSARASVSKWPPPPQYPSGPPTRQRALVQSLAFLASSWTQKSGNSPPAGEPHSFGGPYL